MASQRWTRNRRLAAAAMAALTLAALAAGAARAQEAGGAESAPRFDPLSRLEVHAFFNQAWAKSDGSVIEGIPEDGTTDYRTLALQFRYAITLDDVLVVQLQNESRGESLVDEVRDEIEVDWAFYEHRFNESAGLRLGRVRVPLGIYNEIRDVGTLLPFFEPPEGIYSDGLFTQESVDGAALYYQLTPAAGWRLTLDGYYGEWDRQLVLPTDVQVDLSHADGGAGLQAWLETPVDGLRFGLGGLRYDVSGSLYNLEDEDTWKLLVASLDATFDRWIARAEYMDASYSLLVSSVLAFDDGSYESYYGQLGYRLTDHWTLWGQYDVGDVRLAGSHAPTTEIDLLEDYAVSVTFAPRSEILFKAEAHTGEGFIGFVPGISAFVDEPVATDYAIVSVSVAF